MTSKARQNNAENSAETEKSSDTKRALVEKTASKTGSIPTIVKDILFVIVFYFCFTSFAWGSFHIPSGSMEPTLEVGDRIFVSKFAYGYNRFSLPLDPPIFEDRLFESTPKRGDVAVFTIPERDIDFIKRVIGLPGDRIQMTNGRLFINGEMVPRTYLRDVNYKTYEGFDRRVKEYEETLPGGVVHRIYEATDDGTYDNTRLFIVPDGHYFMMGDNRDGSNDSRGNIGFVPIKYFVGEADITTFSLYDCDQGKDVACLGPIPYGRFFRLIE